MAERPIFLPLLSGSRLVDELYIALHWHSGFAPIQKERNIQELHRASAEAGFAPVMEISTKSSLELGRDLSAFNLLVLSERYGWLPLESIFQGSKVFEHGGPFQDLYHLTPREARHDARLRTSGSICGFEFDDESFPSEPKTLFYDWLYLKAIYGYRDSLQGLKNFQAFSDIEFNPSKSVNCQARSVALFVALSERGLMPEAMRGISSFQAILREHEYRPELRSLHSVESTRQLELTHAS